MLGEHVLDAFQRIGGGRRRQRALDDGDLVRLALAGLDNGLGVAFADLDPVGADEGGAAVDRPHVDLDDIDAFVLRALQQLGIGLHVGIMDDNRRRLFRNQRRHRLRAGTGAPIGVAHDHLHAVRFELLLDAREPSLREIEVHRYRHIGDSLAGERGPERALKRLVEALLRNHRHARQYRQNQRRTAPAPDVSLTRNQDIPPCGFAAPSALPLWIETICSWMDLTRCPPAARFPRCAD